MRDALGYRAKIGVLTPATNTIVEPEFAAMQVPGVTNHVSRMPPRKRDTENMDAYRSVIGDPGDLTGCLDVMVACEPDIIALGHSIDSFAGGVAGAAAFQSRLSGLAGGIEVVVPSLAILSALDVLGQPRNIAALTPYMPPGDETVEAFFADAGYQVKSVIGLKHKTPLDIAAATPARLNAAIDELNSPDIEVFVKAGTNSSMAHLVSDMEARTGKPVISVNVATYWHTLRRLGFDDHFPGFGLLAEHY